MSAKNHKTFMSTICIYLIIVLALISNACSSKATNQTGPDAGKQQENVKLSMVDGNATAETKALYSRLWSIQSKGVMFGHHDDLLYGRNWLLEDGRSDVKDVCGDYPAVYSVDFGPVMEGHNLTFDDPGNKNLRRTILEAHARGQVILAAAHLDNPLTGGDAWDNSDNTVVKHILDKGSDVNVKFESWLDNLAQFLHNLKDKNGKQIPIIFRPYHEHNHTWSWWGKSCTTQDEFINFWHFTVEYLRDKKDVHNLIYAISPQLDTKGSTSNILTRWPGDGYVDFIGLDSYNGTNTEALSINVANLEALGKKKKKPVGITETGIEGIRDYNGNPLDQYWTNQILTPIVGHNISMVVMWRNKYDPDHKSHHYFAPFEGQSSAPNFRKFYDTSITLFSSDLPDMYSMADSVTIN